MWWVRVEKTVGIPDTSKPRIKEGRKKESRLGFHLAEV
jgi:hypothetical protein